MRVDRGRRRRHIRRPQPPPRWPFRSAVARQQIGGRRYPAAPTAYTCAPLDRSTPAAGALWPIALPASRAAARRVTGAAPAAASSGIASTPKNADGKRSAHSLQPATRPQPVPRSSRAAAGCRSPSSASAPPGRAAQSWPSHLRHTRGSGCPAGRHAGQNRLESTEQAAHGRDRSLHRTLGESISELSGVPGRSPRLAAGKFLSRRNNKLAAGRQQFAQRDPKSHGNGGNRHHASAQQGASNRYSAPSRTPKPLGVIRLTKPMA